MPPQLQRPAQLYVHGFHVRRIRVEADLRPRRSDLVVSSAPVKGGEALFEVFKVSSTLLWIRVYFISTSSRPHQDNTGVWRTPSVLLPSGHRLSPTDTAVCSRRGAARLTVVLKR